MEGGSFLADMRCQILKMCHERFLTKGPFFARIPTNKLQGFRERRRRERRKIGEFHEALQNATLYCENETKYLEIL